MKKCSKMRSRMLAQTCGALLMAALIAVPAVAAIPTLEGDFASDQIARIAPGDTCGDDNGKALSAPPEKLCSVGVPSSVSGDGPWSWTCSNGARPVAACFAHRVARYNYTLLDYPGASATVIFGLNDFGDVGGDYHMGSLPPHAMVYRHGHFESLDPQGVFGDNLSVVGGLNDWGAIVGGYADDAAIQHGFLLIGDHFEVVDFPGHLNTNAVGINLFGAMIGVYWDADVAYHGVLRRYGHDTPIEVPGARETYPTSINSNGEIVGYWDVDPTELHSFYRSRNGRITPIADVPSSAPNGTLALSLNDFGQIAGYYVDTNGVFHGFVVSNGRYDILDVPGSLATLATVINNFGQVAGEYYDAAGNRRGFLATPER